MPVCDMCFLREGTNPILVNGEVMLRLCDGCFEQYRDGHVEGENTEKKN